MQQIVYYTHEICFSHVGEDGEQFYAPKYFMNQQAFNLEPMEEVVVVMENCGAAWFRTGISHDMILNNGQWEFSKNSPKQLCLFIRNYSEQARIFVEQGTELSSLLNQMEIIFKLVNIPIEFFRGRGTNVDWVSDAENLNTIDDEEEENREAYYVKIFKKQ